jgi:hypothetical protein
MVKIPITDAKTVSSTRETGAGVCTVVTAGGRSKRSVCAEDGMACPHIHEDVNAPHDGGRLCPTQPASQQNRVHAADVETAHLLGVSQQHSDGRTVFFPRLILQLLKIHVAVQLNDIDTGDAVC